MERSPLQQQVYVVAQGLLHRDEQAQAYVLELDKRAENGDVLAAEFLRAVVAQYNPNARSRAIFAKEAEGGQAAGAAGAMRGMKTMKTSSRLEPIRNKKGKVIEDRDATGAFMAPRGGWKSKTDVDLVDYMPHGRPLSRDHLDVQIADVLPGAKHVDYAEAPFFGKLQDLEGMGKDAHVDPWVNQQHRDALFTAQPEKQIDLHHVMFTQPAVNKAGIQHILAHPERKGSDPYVLRYQGVDYMIDGHHRSTAMASQGKTTVTARYLNLDDLSSIRPAGPLPPLESERGWPKQKKTVAQMKLVRERFARRRV